MSGLTKTQLTALQTLQAEMLKVENIIDELLPATETLWDVYDDQKLDRWHAAKLGQILRSYRNFSGDIFSVTHTAGHLLGKD